MILPEVRHHFLHLALARDGAGELRGLHVAEDALVLPQLVAHLRVVAHQLGAHVALAVRVALLGQLLALLPQRDLAFRVHGDEVARRTPKHLIGCDDAVSGAVGNSVRRKLKPDPLVYAHRAYLGHVARTRAEAEAVEHLLHLLVGRLFARLRGRDDNDGSMSGARGLHARRLR